MVKMFYALLTQLGENLLFEKGNEDNKYSRKFILQLGM